MRTEELLLAIAVGGAVIALLYWGSGKMLPRFCERCGSKLVERQSPTGFHGMTGRETKPQTWMACPRNTSTTPPRLVDGYAVCDSYPGWRR